VTHHQPLDRRHAARAARRDTGCVVIAFNRIAQRFEDRGRFGYWQSRDDAMLHCSGLLHRAGDRHPSLRLSNGHGRALLYCFAYQCPVQEILAGVDLTMRDLFDDNTTTPRASRVTPTTPSEIAEHVGRREKWSRDGVLDAYVVADEIRNRYQTASALRQAVQDAGPDGLEDDAVQHLAVMAADYDQFARRLEMVLDDAMSGGGRP